MDTDTSEDTEFVKFWNTVLEPKFTKYRHILQGGLSRYSAKALPSLPIKAGMKVLDVGCGWGDLTLKVAELVGPEGHVVGIDCVESFLQSGRSDATKKSLENVEFRRGDAEVSLPQNEFDYVVARFGTMFFTNPVPALRRMRLALKPGCQMTHIVWRGRSDNPAWEQAKIIALRHLPQPSEDADSCGPGPFSMANKDMVTGQMKSAGFDNINFLRVDEKIMVGRNSKEAIAFALAIGPAGEVFREAGKELAKAKRADIEAEMLDFFESLENDETGVWAPTSSWVISARNPG